MGARGRRSGVVVILIVIIIIVVAGLVLVNVLRTPPTEGPGAADATVTPIPTPTPPPTIQIIIAVRDLPRGARLGVQDVTILPWPVLAEAPPPPNALIVDTDCTEDPVECQAEIESKIGGRIARVDILNQQPVLDHMLTPGDEPAELGDTGSDAALLIPTNTVAMAIPITRLSSVGYALRQGDHVDILMSFKFVDVDEDFQTILPNNVGVVVLPSDLTPDDQNPGGEEIGFSIVGREEDGPFGTTLLVIPSALDAGVQRPRQVTQLVIDNAIVLRMGTWSLSDLDQPIVITAAPPPTPIPEVGEGTPQPEAVATETPTPLPVIQVPDIVTLILSRQDALVLKYALETGADIDFVLRSALDDAIDGIVTDSVTLDYILTNYNVAIPPRLEVAQEPRIDLLSGGILDLVDTIGGESVPAEGAPAP